MAKRESKQQRGQDARHSSAQAGEALLRAGESPDVSEDQLAALGSIAGAYAAGEPHVYRSSERGAVEIDAMDPVWRERAAKAVADGRRPANSPRVVAPLQRGLGRGPT